MSEVAPNLPESILKTLRQAVKEGEPRALELVYALHRTLPRQEENELLGAEPMMGEGAEDAIKPEVRAMLDSEWVKYEAFEYGALLRVELGNVNVLAFERIAGPERLLIVNNLAPLSQPVKFRDYAGRVGWDILNRVEFNFPVRAQLEPYEFLWLMVDA